MKHRLFETRDTDKPSAICDSNGEVVLSMCRWCHKAESQLDVDGKCEPDWTPFEAAFHKKLKRLVTKRQQGYIMGAFREAHAEAALPEPGDAAGTQQG